MKNIEQGQGQLGGRWWKKLHGSWASGVCSNFSIWAPTWILAFETISEVAFSSLDSSLSPRPSSLRLFLLVFWAERAPTRDISPLAHAQNTLGRFCSVPILVFHLRSTGNSGRCPKPALCVLTEHPAKCFTPLPTLSLYWSSSKANDSPFSLVPLQIRYHWPYEPYILMKTAEMPRYSEDLVDRMADKAFFTQELHSKGYALPMTDARGA